MDLKIKANSLKTKLNLATEAREEYPGLRAEWEAGAKNGYGVWKAKDGSSYVGEWKNNKSHGYGVHHWKSGDKYEGQWVDGLKSGSGTERFSNGDTYTGPY